MIPVPISSISISISAHPNRSLVCTNACHVVVRCPFLLFPGPFCPFRPSPCTHHADRFALRPFCLQATSLGPGGNENLPGSMKRFPVQRQSLDSYCCLTPKGKTQRQSQATSHHPNQLPQSVGVIVRRCHTMVLYMLLNLFPVSRYTGSL